MFLDDPILPPAPDGAVPVMHNREYRIESYQLSASRLLVQGALRDQKPPGLFVPGDPQPLTIHHMTVALEVSVPGLVIETVSTNFPTHPQAQCPSIIGHYDALVGLSIARGFGRRVRELFGGPRGCSHTTALLQAMAPVALQSLKGMEVLAAEKAGTPHPIIDRPQDGSWKRLVNTCHVFAEGSDLLNARQTGSTDHQTLVVIRRLDELSKDTKDAPQD